MKFCTLLILVSLAMGSFAGPSIRSFRECDYTFTPCGQTNREVWVG